MMRKRRSCELIELVGLISGLCLIGVALHFDIDADGAVRYSMLKTLVHDHRLTADKYSAVQSIFAIPLYIVGNTLGQPERFVARFNLIVFSVMLAVLYRRLSKTIDPALLRWWFLTMLACSMFLHHVRMFFTELLSAALVVVGLVCLLTGSPVVGASALCLGVVNSPALLVGLVCVSAVMSWQEKRPRYLLLPVVAVSAILVEGWIRRGNPFITGYEHESLLTNAITPAGVSGFTQPFVLGFISIFFSYGKGLFFFAPGLFLATGDQQPALLRRLHGLLLAMLAGMVVVYAKWWGWYGGWFWGPRYFLLASVPPSLSVGQCRRDRSASPTKSLTARCVLVLSAWVGITGGIFGLDQLAKIGTANNYALEYWTWYVPSFSPLWYPFIEHRPLTFRDFAVGLYVILVVTYLSISFLDRFQQASRGRVQAEDHGE